MATIQKLERRNGTKYRVQIRRQGHKNVSRIFDRKKDAELWARKLEGDTDALDSLPGTESRRRTVAQAIDTYMLGYSGRDNALAGRLHWWHIEVGHLSLERLTAATIRDALRKLATDRTSATCNRYLAALSAVCRWAVKAEWMARNPARGIERQREAPGRTVWLTDKQRGALLTACDASEWPDLGLLVRMALSTGARRGELLALRWSDLDLDKGLAHVRDSKSGEPRMLPLIQQVQDLLKPRAVPGGDGLLFPSLNDPSVPIEIRTPWEKAREAAGLPDFRFHDIRHSCASYLAMNGATLLEIADVLGHKTLAMVKRYSHLSTSHKTALITRVLSKVGEQVDEQVDEQAEG